MNKIVAKDKILRDELFRGDLTDVRTAEVNHMNHLVVNGNKYYFYDNAADAAHDLELVKELI